MPGVLLTSYYTIQNPSTGGKRRVAELVQALQPDVHLLQPPPAPRDAAICIYPRDFGRRKHGINWGIFNLYWPSNRRAARQAARRLRPDVLLNASIWCHDAFSGLKIPRVLDAQNVDALAIAGRFGSTHPFTQLVRRKERQACLESEQIFCCSQTDAEAFQREYGLPESKLTVAPNGVRLPEQPAEDPLANQTAAELAGQIKLFFMGKLDYAPNEEALAFLAEFLLPELERRLPGKVVCLVSGGPGLPAGVWHPALRYIGRVPDVAPWLALADVCLAPVFSGSGTRLKVLEYFAAGKPVVATAKAVEGLDVQDGREFRLAERNHFAEVLLHLLHSLPQASEMAARARQLVQARYSWDQTARIWQAGLAPFLPSAGHGHAQGAFR
ncbi:MAG: glycosyltransferase family 4 protein [Verrucomicrobiota bacterium]|nr:glycosyltransferase family 4 protein [Verrucomicrobiota bacterium]